MAARTKRKTAISIRKDQDQREPAGRRIAGGTGLALWEAIVEVVTGRSSLGEGQLPGGGIVIENFRVTSPLDGGLQLSARFLLAEVFVEKVTEEFIGEGAVRFCSKGVVHLAKQRNICERGLAEDGFARLDVRFRKGLAFRRDYGVALFEREHSEEHSGVHRGEQRVHFEAQLISKFVKVRAAAMVHEDFKQARQSAGARVRKHDDFTRQLLARSSGFLVNWVVLVVGPGKDTINLVNKLNETRRLAVTRMRDIDRKICVDVSGVAAQDDDAIGEDDGFFDIVRDDEYGPRGNFVFEPQ